MKKYIIAFYLVGMSGGLVSAQDYVSKVWVSDQGDGTYKNPVLYADYSDPDACRVGDDYYLTSSSFGCLPGLQILHSKDLVNWSIIGAALPYAVPPINDNSPQHGNRVWAPSIRYHNGEFYIFWGDPDQGVYMVKSSKVEGPWSEPVLVKSGKGIIDTTPLWDDDGRVYMVHAYAGSRAGLKSVIAICELNAEATQAITQSRIIFDGHEAHETCEGPKFYKRNGYYYIFHPAGGVATGWQVVLRSKNIYGPYEKKVVLEQGNTTVNGPHQGALVDTPEGEWWFFHFQLTEPLGRVVHLQPVCWMENWPVIGVDMDMNGIGEPVKVWTKPGVSKSVLVSHPQTTDDFNSYTLGLQWFNHNPVNTHWSLNERRGWLALKALKAATLRESRNMLTQKCMGYLSTATVLLDFSALADGQRGGLFCTGSLYNGIGISREEGKNYLYLEKNGDVQQVKMVSGKKIYLRVMLDAKKNCCQLFYSFDNCNFILCGDAYSLKFGDWKGARVGLYSYNTLGIGGKCYFDWFNYDFN